MDTINSKEIRVCILQYMNPDGKTVTRSYVFLLLLIIILVLSAFIPASWLGLTTPIKKYTPIDFTQIKADDIKTYDSNNNGLVTWEELTKSTKYGDAIIQEAQANPPSEDTLRLLNDPNNLTSSFSKNLYIASNQIINAGGVSAEDQQKILEELTAQEVAKTVSKKYLYSEIHVAKSEDTGTIRAYGNAIASLLKGIITEKTIGDEANALALFASIKDQDSTSDIDALRERASYVDTTIKKVLALSTPPSASVYQIMLLNQLTVYRDTLSNLSKAGSDPMRAKIAFSIYPGTTAGVLAMYKQFSNYFNLKNVIFSASEAGYVFTIGYTLE